VCSDWAEGRITGLGVDEKVMLNGTTSSTISAVDVCLEHVHSVMILRLLFGLVWHLQGNERAAPRHGGHHYEVGGGCACPGRRGSDLLCERVCRDRVFSTECGNLLSNGMASRWTQQGRRDHVG
jgi:hypothetical protein